VFCSRSSCKYFVVNNSHRHRHHHSTSSPLTIVTHHHQSWSSSVVVITSRDHNPRSPSSDVVVISGHHHLSVDRLSGPRGSSSPTTDVEDGRQLQGSSTPTGSRKTAVNREIHRHPWCALKTGDALWLTDRWKIVVISSVFLTSPVYPVGSGFNIFGIDRPRCITI